MSASVLAPGALVRALKGDGDFYRSGCLGVVVKVHPLSGNVLVAFEKGEFKRCADRSWWADTGRLEEVRT